MIRSLTNVLLEFGSLCADDGSQHLHVFFGFCQQSRLANGSWRPAPSLINVLFRDASHCSLMMDCGNYMYFSVLRDCYSYIAAGRRSYD